MRRQTRGLGPFAIIVIAGLILGACGRDGSSSTTPTTAASTTAFAGSGATAATGGAVTTTADRCKTEAPAATEVGISATDITVTVLADVGSPLAPGLYQANVDAMNAYAKYVNANGGIGCRQLKVRVWDSKLDATESKNGLIDACSNSVALVGGTSLFNPDVSPITGCVDKANKPTGLPDVPALAIDINEQCNKTTYTVQVIVEACTTLTGSRPFKAIIGPTQWYQKNLEPNLHGVFLVPGDLPTTVQASVNLIASQANAGVKWDGTPKVSGRDEQAAYTPRIQVAKAANATYVYGGSNDRSMWTMRKEAKAQGLTSVKVWACSISCYTPAFLTNGGAEVEGTYLWIPFLPFEEADTNPEAAAYVKATGADKVTSHGAQAWQSGVLFSQVVNGIVAKSGPNALTRQAILDGLAATKDFTANGWIGAKDLRGVSPCFMIMKVEGGKFVRVYPTAKGTLDCAPSNIVTVTLDPAEEAKKIS